jgi:hypothetical protein
MAKSKIEAYQSCMNTRCKRISSIKKLEKMQADELNNIAKKCSKEKSISRKKTCFKDAQANSKFAKIWKQWKECETQRCSKYKLFGGKPKKSSRRR